MSVLTKAFDHRGAAARGISWMLIQTIGIRALTFAGQLTLGWLLVPRDFGLYAIALSTANAVGALRNGGIAQLLLRQSTWSEGDVGRLTKFAWLFNFVAAALLVSVAPIASVSFANERVGWLILWIAMSFPSGTYAMVMRTELAYSGRYRELTILGVGSTLFWQVGTIVLAWSGFGPYSYVVPTALQGIVETGIGYLFLRRLPVSRSRLTAADFRRIFRETRWVMLGAAMLSLATTGDYFAVGLFADASVVGKYFFGFQLVTAVSLLLSYGVEQVLPPLLSRMNVDPIHQSQAMLDFVRVSCLVSAPLAGLLSLAAAPVIHLLWGGRWDDAVVVVQRIGWCLPAFVVVSVVRALIEAQGRWQLRFLFLGVYGVGGIASAAYGAWVGSVEDIALLVAGFYSTFGMCLLILMPRIIAVNPVALLAAALTPIGLSALAAAAAYALAAAMITHVSSRFADWLPLGAFIGISALLNATLLAKRWKSTVATWTPVRA